MIIANQSAINYSLKNIGIKDSLSIDNSGFDNKTIRTNFGLFDVLQVSTISNQDTLNSYNIIGTKTKTKTALYLSNFSKELSYFGNVTLKGDLFLPNKYVNTVYVNGINNNLTRAENAEISEIQLPVLSEKFSNSFRFLKSYITNNSKELNNLKFNSFSEKTKVINWQNRKLNCKGNIILFSKDSIVLTKQDRLEDIIVFSPIVKIEDGFEGNLQIYSTKKISIGKNVFLKYPSSLLLYNEQNDTFDYKIFIDEQSKIYGSILMFGGDIEKIDKNSIEIKKKSKLLGDIYCQGKLSLQSNVYGSVYTYKFFLNENQTVYENTLGNVKIDPTKLPNYFCKPQLFNQENSTYDFIKKVY